MRLFAFPKGLLFDAEGASRHLHISTSLDFNLSYSEAQYATEL